MELRHLRYFMAVADAGSMTRAAEKLGIQQPPLSQQIKALERELKTQLFKRVARGVELTVAGTAFRYDVQTILRQVELAASRAARIAAGVEGSIAVGFSTSAAAHALVPHLIRAFRDAHPGVSLDVRESNAAELTDWVAKGTLQAAIFRAPVSRPTDVGFYSLLHEPMLVVLPIRHALATTRKSVTSAVSLRALRDEGFILVRRPGAPGMYADFISACREQGFSPRIVAEVDRMLTNICLVAAGFGISVVPTSMRLPCRERGLLPVAPLATRGANDLGLSRRRNESGRDALYCVGQDLSEGMGRQGGNAVAANASPTRTPHPFSRSMIRSWR
jgi:DNA-binding transcriptional LysR family regulator